MINHKEFTIESVFFELKGKKLWFVSRPSFYGEYKYLNTNCTIKSDCKNGWFDTEKDAKKALYLYNQGFRNINIKDFGTEEFFFSKEEFEI